MPSLLPLRLPLPSLKCYVMVTLTFSLITIAYIHFTIVPNSHHVNIFRFEQPLDSIATLRLIVSTILREPWALLVALNLMICALVLSGFLLMWLVYNHLRPSEIQLARDKLQNFIFYKFSFVFGILNVQELSDLMGWFGWFSVFAFLHTFANVSNHRITLYASTPATSRKELFKHSLLLSTLLIASIGILFFTILSTHSSINILLFALAESLILFTKTSYVSIRLAWYMAEELRGWRLGEPYYGNLLFELTVLSIDLLHHLHMLFYGNIFLSMASLVVIMQLRQLFQALKGRLSGHFNFQRVVLYMQTRFPMEEAPTETCAICWEPLHQARKLPCSHLFHNNCLRSWLEQDLSCPTCRSNLRPTPPTTPPPTATPPTPPPTPPPTTSNIYNRFYFDGSRIINWLPSFSLEVSHRRPNQESSAFNNTVWQVREVFPHHPIELIRADLRSTRSIHATIENIVEGRLAAGSDARYVETHEASSFPDAGLPSTVVATAAAATTAAFTAARSVLTTPSLSSSILPNTTATIGSTTIATLTTTQEIATASSNIPQENATATTATPQEAVAATRASHFSFSGMPEEREMMLKDRKENMLKSARRRFLQNQGGVLEGSQGSKSEEGSSVD